jgi:hypothetical protein
LLGRLVDTSARMNRFFKCLLKGLFCPVNSLVVVTRNLWQLL